ncbi:MAG: carboxypeptidase regulatory-like domain-containing protein [Sphingopyxis sp.]|nr:carboxypeptidase regulatory-like domain-containing protein [Sphingopyxis sp.]
MRLLTKIFGAFGAAMGASALLLAAPAAAQSRTISNTAVADWQIGGQSFRTNSNRVDTLVSAPLPNQPSVSTYRLVGDRGNFSAPLAPTRCAGRAGPVMIEPAGAFASLPTDPAQLLQSSQFSAGDVIVVAVLLPSANINAAARDTVDVTVRLANGDAEQLTLVEDAIDSNRFIGMINSLGVPPPIVAGDCRLSVTPGSSISLTVAEVSNSALTATAVIDFLVDPFGIVFDSGDGTPVTGVQVTIVDAATGQPAQVFGDDGVSSYPSTMVTGQNVTDSSGRVYTFPAGDYRFPFVAPGTYRLVVTPPAPFTAPSTAPPAALADYRRPDDGLPLSSTGPAMASRSP